MRLIQEELFGRAMWVVPETEGIKYAGSKLNLISYILEMVSDLNIKTVLDGFSGTTRVSQAFAKLGFNVIANDIAEWSEVFGKCYLLNPHPKEYYKPLIEHLNSLTGYDGWFTEHYGGEPSKDIKKPFQRKNTRKCDAIRDEIERLGLNDIEKAVALTSLILALDAVDNTLGHHASYLSRWSERSYHDLCLKVPMVFISKGLNKVFKQDIFETVRQCEVDLAYFDPPYGSNNDKMPPSRIRYASYYHIWTSVIKNDKPKVFGKVNRREDTRDNIATSVFEEFRKDDSGRFIALQAIQRLIEETNARYILLSYSSGGRATKEELFEILTSSGKLLKTVEIEYKQNVMSGMRWTNEWVNTTDKHREYLFLLEK